MNLDRGQVFIDREAGRARKIDSEPFLIDRKPDEAFSIDKGQIYIDREAGKARKIDSEPFLLTGSRGKPSPSTGDRLTLTESWKI